MTINQLYLISKFTAVFACFGLNIYESRNAGGAVLTVLAFSCLFLLQFLLSRYKNGKKINICIMIAGIAAAFALPWIYTMAAVQIILTAELAELFVKGRYYYIFVFALSAVMLILIPQETIILIIDVVFIMMFITARITVIKTEKLRNQLIESREAAAEMRDKYSRLASYCKSVSETTALKERNRFSVRIHDQLGHGISGSIFLLEAAKLNIESNPEQAVSCIDTAAKNLRTSVDDIRRVLKEERPEAYLIGAADLKSALNQFGVEYSKNVLFEISGDSEKITYPIWKCISDNMNEAMANSVKHSDFTEFKVAISVMNRIIRAEFSDNGSTAADVKKGMGLSAIEERTVSAGGRSLFLSDDGGFHTVCIFYLKGEAQ